MVSKTDKKVTDVFKIIGKYSLFRNLECRCRYYWAYYFISQVSLAQASVVGLVGACPVQ